MGEVDRKGKDIHHSCDRERNKETALHKATPPLGVLVWCSCLLQTQECGGAEADRTECLQACVY